MPAERTEVTEIVTALGMLGEHELAPLLEARPASLVNVTSAHYDTIAAAVDSGNHGAVVRSAWQNGAEFARAREGLGGRNPWRLEWKGNHRPPSYDQVPADLRVDHVYLISCKYGSDILMNSSPANLFDRRLSVRRDDGGDWYLKVAPDAYQEFYAVVARDVDVALPPHVSELSQVHRDALKRSLPRVLDAELAGAYIEFARDVADRSARRWLAALDDHAAHEEMLWRLLRLQPAPYFVLGGSADGSPLRYRVGTPWDFRSRFRVEGIQARADRSRRQPVVTWEAWIEDRQTRERTTVRGHVEVRWSHGRFASAPEAKVYLDTPHHSVPGYFPLEGSPDPSQHQMQLEWGELT